MALTTAQKNELATRLIEAQQTNNYGSFNDLVRQLRLTQADFLENFPAINQAGINEQISRGAVVPTTAPTAVTYTTSQVTNAIRDALNAGFTVQQARQGAMTNFGLSSADFDRALQQVQSSTYNTTFSDARVAQAIQDSLAQGFTLDQARKGALANYGVSDAQFNRALALVSGGTQGMRGSAPLYQFPGLLTGREDMATGAQRFISRAPGSLLFDVPKVEGGQFTFTPGAFDYNAIRNQQAGADQVQEMYNQQNQIQSTTGTTGTTKTTGTTGTTGTTTGTTTTGTTTGTTTTGTTTGTGAGTTYTDAQVAQALLESMAQGFSLDQSLFGASTKYGISADQLARARLLLPSSSTSTKTTLTTTTPTTTTPTTTTTTARYTDAQVARALQESMNQGFSLVDSMSGAARVYGVPMDQIYRAADTLEVSRPVVNQSITTGLLGDQQSLNDLQQNTMAGDKFDSGLLTTKPTYSNQQIAQAIIDSLGQGYTMDQIQQGAFSNFGVNTDQFNQAAGLLPSMGYTIGQGFAQR